MVATAGSLVTQVETAKKCGAKRVIAMAPHGLFTGDAVKKIRECEALDMLYVTNSVEPSDEVWEEVNREGGKIKIIDISSYFAQVIHHLHTGIPMSDFYLD